MVPTSKDRIRTHVIGIDVHGFFKRTPRIILSALLNGRPDNFSSERLMQLLTALGRDVE